MISAALAHFILNTDEMGYQDLADAHDIICFFPRDVADDEVFYPVSRTGKYIKMFGCIAAEESSMRPALIIMRKTFDDELLLFGFTLEKVGLYSQAHSFIDIEIVDDWFRDTFIPELDAGRERFASQWPAFLITGNCTAHCGLEFDPPSRDQMVVPIWLPSHSSNQL
jgi:hypothetical protein